MRPLNSSDDIHDIYGGYALRLHTFTVFLTEDTPEESFTFPSGDVLIFKKDGVFSNKGVFFELDHELMARNSIGIRAEGDFFDNRNRRGEIGIDCYNVSYITDISDSEG